MIKDNVVFQYSPPPYPISAQIPEIVIMDATAGTTTPTPPRSGKPCFSMNAEHDIAQMLAPEMVRAVIMTLISVLPKSPLSNEITAISAESVKKPIRLKRQSFLKCVMVLM